MGYGTWGYGSMISGVGGLGLLLWLAVFIDLVLAGVWLWQQISKK